MFNKKLVLEIYMYVQLEKQWHMQVLKTYAEVHVRVLAHTWTWINQLNQCARLQSNGSKRRVGGMWTVSADLSLCLEEH